MIGFITLSSAPFFFLTVVSTCNVTCENVRYELNGIGEMEDLIFNYFLDEKGETFKRTTWERDPKNNKIILEGVVSNGL